MTYPQPRTSDQIAGGAKQWRLFTKVTGQGEIYEIDSSSTAIALGPQSDFGNLQIAYLDTSLAPTLVGTVPVTPQYPFAGALTPRFDTTYPISPGRAGRMLVSLLDNWKIGYKPKGWVVSVDSLFYVTPLLDLIGWQTMPPTLPQKRADKTFLFNNHNCLVGANGTLWYIIPIFGRKTIFIDFFNNSGGAINYEVRGVNFTTVSAVGITGPNPGWDEETELVASVSVADQASNTKVVTASATGMFDALAINVGTMAGGNILNAPLRIIVSDDAV